MEKMNITSAEYISYNGQKTTIKIIVNGETLSVPNGAVGNRHYDEIMRQVALGELTITDNGGGE